MPLLHKQHEAIVAAIATTGRTVIKRKSTHKRSFPKHATRWLEEELDALMPALFFHVGFRDVVENLLCVSESMSGSGVPGMAILGISGEGSQGSSSKSFVEELRLEGVLVLDAVVEATVVVRGMLGGLAGRNGMATGSTAPTTGGKGMVSVLQGVFF